MFRIAVIGPGSICKTYGDSLKDSSKVKICAIAGRDTEKGRAMAEFYKVPYYVDQDTMYEEVKPDAVLICTPTFTHEEIVRRAIAHQVHVMCEKPFVLDAAAAEQLIREADAAGVRLMVMHVVRFWPEYAHAKAMIDAGELGEIKNVYLNRLSAHPSWCTWHRDPEKSGGGLYDLHIHDLDFAYQVFGPVESVCAVGKQEESGCFNNVSTVLRFRSGVSAVVEGFMNMTGEFGFTTNIRINGSKAAVEMLSKQVYLSDGTTAKTGKFIVYPDGEPARVAEIQQYDPYRREVEYFAECVERNRPMTMVPNEDVVEVLKLLAAVRTSLETGTPVRISESSMR